MQQPPAYIKRAETDVSALTITQENLVEKLTVLLLDLCSQVAKIMIAQISRTVNSLFMPE